MRWAARNLPSSEALLRNPVGRTLFAGPALGKPWRADPADMIEQAELFGNAPGMLPTFEALEGTQPRGLTTLNTPVLLLWGTKDVILLPRQGRRFERLIPGAELRYLKGLGHTPMSDDPELLSEAIEEFALRRSPVQPAAAPA
jgi:pimeloyl-ACP methyl ester carboxylesterase